MKARRGIYAASITPFRADGGVDQERMIGYVRHLLSDGGCDGVAPMGTTGEGTSTPMADRLALPGAFAEAGIEPERVIFGTGAPSTGDAVRLTQACLEAGYPNVLVLPPYFYKTVSEDGLYAHFAGLIEAVGDARLRLYLYHFPQQSAMPIPPSLAARLKAKFGEVVAGLKDSSGDFEGTKAFVSATGGVAEDFHIYPSSEAFLFSGAEAGCAGIISGSTNAFARLTQAALVAKDRDAAMARVNAARDMAGKYPLMQAMKQIEAWRSGDEAWCRMAPPLVPLSEAQKAGLRADLEALELI